MKTKLPGTTKVLLKYLLTVGVPVLSLLFCFAVWTYLGDDGWFYVYRLRNLEERFEEVEGHLELEDKKGVLGLEENLDTDALLREYKRDSENVKESTLKFSPSRKKFAYLTHKFVTNIKEVGDKDYTSLVVNYGDKEETVFQDNFHLSYFEWLSDEEIAVYSGCGTECMIAYLVDLETKTPQEFMLGVGYTWSPNRKYLLAYHYSHKYGISVSDKGGAADGRTVFQLRREHPPSGSGLASKTQAAWSPDSSKLALVIKEESEERLELLIFDMTNNFELIYEKDLENNDFSELGWKDAETVFYEAGGETIIRL